MHILPHLMNMCKSSVLLYDYLLLDSILAIWAAYTFEKCLYCWVRGAKKRQKKAFVQYNFPFFFFSLQMLFELSQELNMLFYLPEAFLLRVKRKVEDRQLY